MEFLSLAKTYEAEMRAFFEDLHQYPEPSHGEIRTNARVREVLGAAGIVCAFFDRVKHGRFSGMALAGLIVGIVGVCLGIGMLILSLVAESLLIQMIEDGTIPKEMIQDLVDQGVIAPEDVPEGILDPATTTTSLFTPGGNL